MLRKNLFIVVLLLLFALSFGSCSSLNLRVVDKQEDIRYKTSSFVDRKTPRKELRKRGAQHVQEMKNKRWLQCSSNDESDKRSSKSQYSSTKPNRPHSGSSSEYVDSFVEVFEDMWATTVEMFQDFWNTLCSP